ncbi:MAG TPA: choice-of-anchor D domain-containing protein, partial [Anaeromyxobacter sp.]|nr:choice-of-anchor D domain-containing protein [Anaeromyxobacter sp.]
MTRFSWFRTGLALAAALSLGTARADSPTAGLSKGPVVSERDGSTQTPMRRTTNGERNVAAARAAERQRAAGVKPKSRLAPAPKPTASVGGAGMHGAVGALLDLALAQAPDLFAVPNYANSPLPTATCSASATACVSDIDCPGYLPPIVVGTDLIPGGETCTGPVQSGGIRKFVDALPGLCALGKNNLGQCLPIAVPDTTKFPGSDYYELGLKDYRNQFHSDLAGPTGKGSLTRGYYQKNAPVGNEAGNMHYLGPVIIAQTGRPVRVYFTNELGVGAAGDLFIPVDETLPGAGLGPDGVTKYTENRAAIHLHGGNTPWISDGTQHQWTAPVGETNPYKKGWTVGYVPDMWYDAAGNPIVSCSGQPTCAVAGATNNPGDGKLTFYWTNQQSGRFMFYHDHAYAITRLNVYAGEAAGYLIANPPDEDALAAATIPGTLGTKFFDPTSAATGATAPDLTHVFPLVIQDRTFVPPPAQLQAEDPTWDTAKWGQTADIWYPHVYTPNQWPDNPDLSSTNPMGRWDYGPWFWPPQTSLTEVLTDGTVVNRPLTQPCTSAAAVTATNPTGATSCPTTPAVSAVPESFMDTPVVNGTAYPTLTVDPVAYRFQLLNAAQERNFNLSFFVADASGKEVTMVPAVPHTPIDAVPLCAAGAPLSAVTGLPTTATGGVCWPRTWPNDGRQGGVPDPATAGPKIVQIGTEGGLLAAPAIIPAQPVNYEYNRRNIVVLNVSDKALFLGPAERADVVVDFSAYAGKTLILYNDSPAPVPGFDLRLDYFTGDRDETATGGAPTTLPGYGPNIRTIMQIKVNATVAGGAPPNGTFNLAAASAAVSARFKVSQPTPIVPEAGYNAALGTAFGNTYSPIQGESLTFTPACASLNPVPAGCVTTPVTLNFGRKAIQELFDTDYGRMNATLGVEVPVTNFLTQTTIPYANFDPVTEFISDNQPQIWKITHNGVDTHTIHFHLMNLQILNRVGWDGQIRPPDANEIGWKESIRMHPLEDVIVALQPVRQQLPWPIPDLVRPLDVTRPLHTTTQFTGVDVNNLPITVSNEMTNFGWEYIWHCHLLGHEEADMLRAEVFVVAPEDPTNLVANASLSSPGTSNLSWNDNSKSALTFNVQRDTSPAFAAPVTFSVAAPSVQPGPVTWSDTTGVPSTMYYYRVQAQKTLSSPAIPGSTYTAISAWSNVAQLGFPPQGGISPATLAFGNQQYLVQSTAKQVTVSNTGLGALSFTVSIVGANPGDFAQTNTCAGTVAPGGSCTINVTFTPTALGARAATLSLATNDPVKPTLTSSLTGTGFSIPATGVTLTPSLPSPQIVGTAVVFTAQGQGSTGPYQYQFWLKTGNTWAIVQPWSSTNTWTLAANTAPGTYSVQVEVRTKPSGARDAITAIGYTINPAAATGVTVTPSAPSPHKTG